MYHKNNHPFATNIMENFYFPQANVLVLNYQDSLITINHFHSL